MSQDLGKFLSETSRNYSLRKEANAKRLIQGLVRETAKTAPGAVAGYGADSAYGGDGLYGALVGGALGRKTRLGQNVTRGIAHAGNKALTGSANLVNKTLGNDPDIWLAEKARNVSKRHVGRDMGIDKAYRAGDIAHAQKGVKKDLASEMHDASRSAGRMEDKSMKAQGADLHAKAVKDLVGQGMSSQKAGVVADKLLKKHYNNGAPSLLSNLRHAPMETVLEGTLKGVKNMPHKKKMLAGGALTGVAYAGKDKAMDMLEESLGGDPAADRLIRTKYSKPNSEASVDAELAPAPAEVGGTSPEDTVEKESTMDKLSGYGKDVLGKIQSFANTRGGSAAIGGATGAGLAYLADKLMSDDDDDEDRSRKRSLLSTLIGAVGGAGIGMGVQHYMGKSASDAPTKLQAAIREEASHMTDEDLEETVRRLELRDKTAAQTEYLYRRLHLNFSSNPIT